MVVNKWAAVGVLLIVLVAASACTSIEPYNVTYKSSSNTELKDVTALWGEYRLNTSRNYSPVDSADISYSGPTYARLNMPIPDKAGAKWRNANDQEVEFFVSINKELIPELNQNQYYEFVVELRQSDIRQVELIVHDENNMRIKKKKVMLYCALPDKSCKFNSPFTTDTFYDYESLTPAQLKKLQERQAAARRIMAPFHEDMRKKLGDKSNK